MKTFWSNDSALYDGRQLRSLFAYETWGISDDSIIAWQGPCQVRDDAMLDLEDVRAGAVIASDSMVHFVSEVFRVPLIVGVLWQRTLSSIVGDFLNEQSPSSGLRLHREGDDLFCREQRKLSISVAAASRVSVLVHFAVNVTTDGTPVPTVGLESWSLDPKSFANEILKRASEEWVGVRWAEVKVRPTS